MKAISPQEIIALNTPPIVSPEAWEAARLEMLGKEKAFTRTRDGLAAERRHPDAHEGSVFQDSQRWDREGTVMLMARLGHIVLPIEGGSAIAATATDSFGRDAFVQLAEPYRRQIKAHCYRMTGSLHEAEDLVQETYLRAWRAFESFEGVDR